MHSNFKDDLQEGPTIYYYQNGQMAEKSYWASSKANGLSEAFYNNGQKKTISNWKNNLREGEVLNYDSLGKLKIKELWKNGKLMQ